MRVTTGAHVDASQCVQATQPPKKKRILRFRLSSASEDTMFYNEPRTAAASGDGHNYLAIQWDEASDTGKRMLPDGAWELCARVVEDASGFMRCEWDDDFSWVSEEPALAYAARQHTKPAPVVAKKRPATLAPAVVKKRPATRAASVVQRRPATRMVVSPEVRKRVYSNANHATLNENLDAGRPRLEAYELARAAGRNAVATCNAGS